MSVPVTALTLPGRDVKNIRVMRQQKMERALFLQPLRAH